MKKTMYRILSVLLLMALLLTFAACGQSPADEVTPLLWRVESETGGVVYLMGSIHSAPESLYPLPDYVMDAYNSSDYLAVEFDLLSYEKDTAAVMETSMALMYTDGTTVRDHISAELYDRMELFLKEYGMYTEAYDQYNMNMWNSLISSTIVDMTYLSDVWGVDRHFLGMAHEDGTEILEVESAASQTQLLGSFSDDFMAVQTQGILENPQLQAAQVELLYETWAKGDLEALTQICVITEEQILLSGEWEEEMRQYNELMYINRNIHMAQTAHQYLENGMNVFFTVGAAHMVGDNGIVALLEDMGYTVEVVTPQQ